VNATESKTPPSGAALTDDQRGLGFSLPSAARPSRARVLLLILLGAGVLAIAFFAAYLPRVKAHRELAQAARANEGRLARVAVLTPKLVADGHTLKLPGSIQPLEEAVIYARANGYVRRWLVDIGAKVQADALLAEIETPEVDQELMQGRAALAQSRANQVQAEATRELAKTRLSRTEKLVEAGVAPQQELDQTQAQSTVGDADVKVAEAAVAAQQANIRRLSDLQSFSRVTAPFAGTITSRSIERGSLVTAGNGTPLFRLAALDPVRVFLQIPQNLAPSVAVGTKARVRIREFADRSFEATVARTAGALDPASRTLNTEIRIPNPDGKLLSGMYAEVELTLPTPHRVYELPATALMVDASGMRVALVTEKGVLHLQPVVLERDLGATVQIASGLEGNEKVVQIASADLAEGERVEIAR
jgi:membrane fusion protein (multidrug efflux system)